MNRNQLIQGIVTIGAGIIIYIVSVELLGIAPSEDLWKNISMILRVTSYIFVVGGIVCCIISVIPKQKKEKVRHEDDE